MMNRFIDLLKKNKEVSAWNLQQVKTKSCELFYVLDKLEMNRATDTVGYSCTIYVDKDEKRGSASFKLFDYMTDAEIEEKIAENVFSAGFAMNAFYENPSPEDAELSESASNLKDRPFTEIIEEVVDACFKANSYKEGYLAATEFFLYETEKRIVTSKGIDLKSKSYKGQIEIIPSWEKDGEEVEVYDMITYESFNPDEITTKVDEELLLAKARFEAKPLENKEGLRVIIQDDEVGQILWSYARELGYASKYMKTNKFEVGQNIQGDNVTGDLLNLTLVPYYKNASGSQAFDGDGVVLKEQEIVKDGVATALHGTYRFGYYLGEKKPTGNIPVLVAKEGTKSFKELGEKPYLRCVKFSGMQVDQSSGYFGGEVRLGFYFDGEKEVPVTGIAVSGNLKQSATNLLFSKETYTGNTYHGPKFLAVDDMTIA